MAGIIMVILILSVPFANASGLFPSMDEMLGTAMPSVGLAIGRVADEIAETDAGSQEIYLNFSEEDYITFGQYLAGTGASIKEYYFVGSTMTALISVRDDEMTFSYNWLTETATVIYPADTRAETELEAISRADSILPPVGGVMPSAEFAIGRGPDEKSTGEEGYVQTWALFTDDDYIAFSTYLAETGAALIDSSIEAGILNAEISLNGFSFSFSYDWNTQSAKETYPEGTSPESSRWNVLVGSGSILPEIKDLGRELPRISMALEREPTSLETLADGSIRETYDDFWEADYNTFSAYLQQAGCLLVDYHTDENGVLVINLTNGSGNLAFSYDALHHIGVAEYPIHTRMEKAWVSAPVSTSEPIVTPEPSTQINATHYSEGQCWDIAYEYFKNIRWKNPQSIKVYGHTTSYSYGSYKFIVDYSGENSFGGTTRSYYYISVDDTTGEIRMAFEAN